ncbi:MAG: ABC transporter permease [Chloroflexota bacterium]|nr:ABC transporter permease [Chloroflexota bacterium]
MDWLTNRSAGSLALALAATVIVALLGCLLLALRAPILVKLGVRNIARRRLRAALIVCGLMLSTLVIGSALGTGDAMTHTMHTLVAGSLGAVDEVVVANPPRNRLRERVRALTEPGLGGLAGANLDLFSQAEVTQITAAVGNSQHIAGTAPAIITQVTVIQPARQQLQSAVPLLAMAPESTASGAFGVLQTAAGQSVSLTALTQDDVVLNAAAAATLEAEAGQTLSILHGNQPWNVRVAAVVRNGGLGGTQPLILVPLQHYQQIGQSPGQINVVLVANHGGIRSVTRSAAAASELRNSVADRAVAEQLYALLARPEIQRGLREAEGLLEGSDQARIVALRVEAALPAMSERFVSLIGEPRTRQRLSVLAWRLPGGAGRRAAALLQDVSALSVLEVKQEALNQANQYGTVISTVFLVLGIFSIAASILLIFLIFALLAADRGAELAIMRALGMRRFQMMRLFVFEGLVYNVLGAGIATGVSVLSAYVAAVALLRALQSFGIAVTPHVAPASLLITFTSGLMLTLLAMLLAAWRISRTDMIAGARGELVDEQGGSALGLGLILLLAAGGVWWQWGAAGIAEGHPLLVPLAQSVGGVGAVGCLQWLLGRRRTSLAGRTLALLGATVLAGIWLRFLLQLPATRAAAFTSAVSIAVGGIMLIPAAVWAVTMALGPVLKLLERILALLPRVQAVIRPAASYLSQQRWRTGLTILMFGMVVSIIVAALTLIDVVVQAYAHTEPPVAGYDLRVDWAGQPGVADMEAALATTPAVSRADFTTIGGVAIQTVAVVRLDAPRASWQELNLAVADGGFLAGMRARLSHRAPGFASDADAWAALGAQAGTAVVAGPWPGADGAVTDGQNQQSLEPSSVWTRPPQGGQPIKLTVIGIVDARSELEPAIYTSQATAAGLGVPGVQPQSYFFGVAADRRLRDVAQGLRLSFAEQGAAVTILGEAQRLIQTVRLLLVQLVQGFLGLGLLAGITALGLLGIQAVLERRQQLGTLRALGFTRRQTGAMLACETAFIAIVSVVLGIALGVTLARSLVGVLATEYPELRFGIPWRSIAGTVAIAWAGSSLTILLAAWQAGRVSPAEALRSV